MEVERLGHLLTLWWFLDVDGIVQPLGLVAGILNQPLLKLQYAQESLGHRVKIQTQIQQTWLSDLQGLVQNDEGSLV